MSFCLAVGAFWKQNQADYLITRASYQTAEGVQEKNMFWINTEAALLNYLRIKNYVGGAIDRASK